MRIISIINFTDKSRDKKTEGEREERSRGRRITCLGLGVMHRDGFGEEVGAQDHVLTVTR
jgi:hypothetical protein